MPGPVASRASLRSLAFAAVAALPILIWTACSTESGTPSTCILDTTENGIVPVEGGCSGFAVCTDDAGVPADPSVCCASIKDSAQQKACLFEYGAAPAPDNFGGSGGGSSSSSGSGSGSSSSGSGMMDAGNNG